MSRCFSGPRLRQLRLAAGLRAEELAIGVDRSVWSINQYERDVARPSVSVLAALADQLGCSVDDMFCVREAVAADAAA